MNRLLPHRYLFILLLTALTSLPFLSRGLFESSEGRYAMVAKTMIETGDYWMPKINGTPHLTKPPLTYWFIAAGQKIFGFTSLGSRSTHLILWLFLVLLVMRIAEILMGKETGLLAGLIYSTALFPAIGSSFLTTDLVVVFFQVFSLWALVEGYRWLFWIGLALAFNTKGPVALFPLIFWFIFLKEEMKLSLHWPGFLLGIVMASFWYIGLEWQSPGTLGRLIQDEIIKRSTTDFSGRNAFWWAPIVTYYVPFVIGWGLWPFYIQKQNFMATMKGPKNRFYWAWIIGTLILFSLIQSRLILYILPLTVPGVLLLAQMIDKNSQIIRPLIINLILLLLMKTMMTVYPYDKNAKKIADAAITASKDQTVFFINEYLYGVEFYLGKKFKRFSANHYAEIEWIGFQDKNSDLAERFSKRFRRRIIEQSRYGIWNFVRLNPLSTSNLHSTDRNMPSKPIQ